MTSRPVGGRGTAAAGRSRRAVVLRASLVTLLGLVAAAAALAQNGAEGQDAAVAQSYVDVWGPAVGSEIPLLDALDQTGARRTLDNLSGDQGLLLFLVRSADW